MNRLGWILNGLFLFFAACIGAVLLGSRAQLRPPAIVPSPRPAPAPAPAPRRGPRVRELRQFAREESTGAYTVKFGFVDYAGEQHVLSCAVTKADVDRERSAYGYVREDLKKTLNERLLAELEAEASRRGVRDAVRITMKDWGGYHLEMTWRDEPTRAGVMAFRDWAHVQEPLREEAIVTELFRDRGFLYQDGKVRIDYNAIARQATPHVDDCLQALLRAAPGYPTKQIIGLLLAFYQELKYEIPPDVVGARRIAGLWVPAEVLVNGKGDCDSKATAFAAMWRRLPPRVIVILVPHHALIGVEAKPGPDESFVRVGNRYFVLCEVAGPGKLRPGYHPIQGDFEYVMIDPA